MKLHASLLMPLCYLCGLLYASTGSSGDAPGPREASDSYIELSIPLATAKPAPPFNSLVYNLFATEIVLEIAAAAVGVVTLGSTQNCTEPTLLGISFCLLEVLYILQLGTMCLRTSFIRDHINAAGDIPRLTATLQTRLSRASGIVAFSSMASVIAAIVIGAECQRGTDTVAAALSFTMMAGVLFGIIQLCLTLANMHLWARDVLQLGPAERANE